MQLSQIMTHNVVTVSMDDTLGHIRELFNTFHFHHVVVAEAGRVTGVISDRDVLKHLSPYVGQISERTLDAQTLKKRAHQIMTRHPVTASAEMSAGDAALLMLNTDISCLPVLDEHGTCVGIVTMKDLLRAGLACLRETPGEARAA